MTFKNIVAMALGAAFVAAPIYASAAQEGGSICGRVNASPSYILALSQTPTHDNVVVARSESEEVQAPVNIDGTYCFTKLHTDIHTITAFENAFPTLRATVTPIPGQTMIVDLTGDTAAL